MKIIICFMLLILLILPSCKKQSVDNTSTSSKNPQSTSQDTIKSNRKLVSSVDMIEEFSVIGKPKKDTIFKTTYNKDDDIKDSYDFSKNTVPSDYIQIMLSLKSEWTGSVNLDNRLVNRPMVNKQIIESTFNQKVLWSEEFENGMFQVVFCNFVYLTFTENPKNQNVKIYECGLRLD